MQKAINLDLTKLSKQIASLDTISKKKKWKFYYDADLDNLYLTPDRVKRDCVLYSVNDEFSVYVDRNSNIGGVFVEYFKSNLSSHDKRFKAFSNLFTLRADGTKTVPQKKEKSAEILKELVTLEDQLTEAYTDYAQSIAIKIMSEEFSKLQTNLNKFKKLFETFAEEKQKHKETIIEIACYFETRETERLRHAAPVVKYQNPDSWVLQSSLHSFTTTPAENATP